MMKKLIKINSELLEQHLEIYGETDRLGLTFESKVEPDAFKNCRDRKIRSLSLSTSLNDLTNESQKTTFNIKHESLFEPLKEHLEELCLKCSWNCDVNFLEHLKKLKILKFVRSAFLNAQPVFKEANNQLRSLYLNNCKLEISDKTMFNDLKCLKNLDLSGVKLATNVLPDLFKEIKQLESLALNETKLTPTENAFIYLENLKWLKIAGISIPEECSNILTPLRKLEKLEMGSTDTFNYDAFRQVKNLYILKLSHYSSIEIDKNFFDNHPNLKSLDLSNLISSNTKIDKYFIDLEALANLKSLAYLYLSDNNLKLNPDCEIFRLVNLKSLDLSLNKRENFIKREINLNETTFIKMNKLTRLSLKGNRIKLEGSCFKHLTNLKQLNLSYTTLDSGNNDYDIFSSLKHVEHFEFDGIEPCESFQLFRLSELINLKEINLKITERDLDQYREMLRVKRRRTDEVEPPNLNPTNDDLCYFILRDLTKLTYLKLCNSRLTYIDNKMFSQMKDLYHLDLSRNNISNIPDDTFDCLSNLLFILLNENPIQQIKLNRLCLKLDKLKIVWYGNATIVDLMDESFNFKSINILYCIKDNFLNLEKFYRVRRFLQKSQQSKTLPIMSSFETEKENIYNMFQTIDIKINEIKSEKEKSIEEELKPFVDQIKLDPIEEKLNQTREEMIKKLKVIHDNSINEINALIKKYKQPIYWTDNATREESLKEAIQSAEKIFKNQFKLTPKSYSILPELSNFIKLKHSNAFKSVKLVKYAKLMPGHLLRELHSNNLKKIIIPIKKEKFIVASLPKNVIANSQQDWLIEIYDINTGLLSNNLWIKSFLLANDHFVIVRNHKIRSIEEISKLDRLKSYSSPTECVEPVNFVSKVIMVEVFDLNLKQIGQATFDIESKNSFDADYVFMCGNGVIIETRCFDNKSIDSHFFDLYSFKLKQKKKKIQVDLKRDESKHIEFKPIKFDDEKCFFYKQSELEYKTSIVIYSFNDSTLLQEIIISIPPQINRYKTMAIDPENENLYFTSSISQTINCFNLQTKELMTSHLRGMDFNKLILTNDDRIILCDTTRNLIYNFEDNFLNSFFNREKNKIE